MCGLIAADEGRHEIAYQRIIDEIFVRDPDGAPGPSCRSLHWASGMLASARSSNKNTHLATDPLRS